MNGAPVPLPLLQVTEVRHIPYALVGTSLIAGLVSPGTLRLSAAKDARKSPGRLSCHTLQPGGMARTVFALSLHTRFPAVGLELHPPLPPTAPPTPQLYLLLALALALMTCPNAACPNLQWLSSLGNLNFVSAFQGSGELCWLCLNLKLSPRCGRWGTQRCQRIPGLG